MWKCARKVEGWEWTSVHAWVQETPCRGSVVDTACVRHLLVRKTLKEAGRCALLLQGGGLEEISLKRWAEEATCV